MRYVILDENNKVINVVISKSPLYPNWVKSDVAEIGDIYIDGELMASGSETNDSESSA